MLYNIVKPLIKIGLFFFCRKQYCNTNQYKKENGPLLLAVNHPNSFLDAIIIGCLFKKPVYFLARGDAFKNSWALKILTALKCIPVYRLREGKEYLHLNDATFDKCRAIFKQNGIVLIFSEGLCINEWNIRPLKKGTARLAFSSWGLSEIGDRLKVLPVGINYSSFTALPKKVYIQFGEFIYKNDFDFSQNEGALFLSFNEKIKKQFSNLCIDGIENSPIHHSIFSGIMNNANQANKENFSWLQSKTNDLNEAAKNINGLPYNFYINKEQKRKAIFKSIILLPLALPALFIYYPIFYFLKKWIANKSKNSGHFDSILFGASTLLFAFLQPIIWLISFLILGKIILSFAFICLLAISGYVLTEFFINCQRISRLNSLSTEQKQVVQRLYNK